MFRNLSQLLSVVHKIKYEYTKIYNLLKMYRSFMLMFKHLTFKMCELVCAKMPESFQS